MLSSHQQFFFETTVKLDAIKNTISSPREFEFMNYLENLGYRLNVDYTHQFASAQEKEGYLFVADFCFPKEKIIIELDGKEHRQKKNREKDKVRDSVFYNNGYDVLRINTPMTEYQKSFWKNVLQNLITDKRNKYGNEQTGDTMDKCLPVF